METTATSHDRMAEHDVPVIEPHSAPRRAIGAAISGFARFAIIGAVLGALAKVTLMMALEGAALTLWPILATAGCAAIGLGVVGAVAGFVIGGARGVGASIEERREAKQTEQARMREHEISQTPERTAALQEQHEIQKKLMDSQEAMSRQAKQVALEAQTPLQDQPQDQGWQKKMEEERQRSARKPDEQAPASPAL